MYLNQDVPDRESRILAFANAAADMNTGCVQLVINISAVSNECGIDVETAYRTIEAEMAQDVADGGMLKKLPSHLISGALSRAQACLGLNIN